MSFKKFSVRAALPLFAFGIFFSWMFSLGNVPQADAAIGAVCSSASASGTCQAACAGALVSGPLTVSCGAGESCCAGATASSSSSSSSTVTIANPLAYNTVQDLLGKLLDALQGIIVTLSLVFIVIGAVLYVTSSGDEGRIKTAKAAITASLIGLAIGIAAPSFLKEISVILGWGLKCDTNGDGIATAAECGSVTTAPTLLDILTKVLDFLLSLIGVLAIIMLVWGGVMYLTSAGDEKRADTAKAIVKWALVGIAVALASLVLVTQVANFF